MKDLEERLVDSESSRATEEEISRELQEQVRGAHHSRSPSCCVSAISSYVWFGLFYCFVFRQVNLLTEELSGVKDQNGQSSAAAEDKELSRLTTERDQLRIELQENMQMVGHCDQQSLFFKRH